MDFPFSLPWRSKQENLRAAIRVAQFILIMACTKAWWQINGPLLGGGTHAEHGSVSKVQAKVQAVVQLTSPGPGALVQCTT